MFVLSKNFKRTIDKEKYKNLFIENAKGILSDGQSRDLIENSDKKIAEKSKSILSELYETKDDPIKRNLRWDDYK